MLMCQVQNSFGIMLKIVNFRLGFGVLKVSGDDNALWEGKKN